MNNRIKAIFTAACIALSASALGARATENPASNDARLESDGAPQAEPAQTAIPKEHETPRQDALNAWFEQERAQPTVAVPYVAPRADSRTAYSMPLVRGAD